jgi:hypothetical protein
MLSNVDYVRQSLELNLFFMRIAKEHSIFLEAGFTTRDRQLMVQAEQLKNVFSQLLVEAIRLSNGVISPEAAMSGEFVTDLTLESERETQFYTGIAIDPNITRMETMVLATEKGSITPNLVRMVNDLNNRAIYAAEQLAGFKKKLLQDVLACRVFTTNYPLLLDHILREALFYLRLLRKLQNREEIDMVREAAYQETFWNRIMAEHSKFIRGLLDPTEKKLFDTANDFGERFDKLTAEAKELSNNLGILPEVTEKSLDNTKDLRDFKKQGTEGLVQCQIKSIAFPLLGDHVVREANHYIRILNAFKKIQPES